MQQKIIIWSLLILALFLGCDKNVLNEQAICTGCVVSAKLNDEKWLLIPYAASFDKLADNGDQLFHITLYSSVPEDEFKDILLFRNIPFKNDSISFDTIFGYTGPNVFFDVHEYEYDVERDSYTIVPGTNSFVKVEIVNKDIGTVKLTFNLTLAVDGDTTKTIRNHTYPSLLNITDGKIEGQIAM